MRALADPVRRGARVGAGECLEQWDPLEPRPGPLQLPFQLLLLPGVDRLRDLALFANRFRRPSPAVVKHLRVGRARANSPGVSHGGLCIPRFASARSMRAYNRVASFAIPCPRAMRRVRILVLHHARIAGP